VMPETRKTLEDAGYAYESNGFCEGCDEPVEFWYDSTGLRTPISILQITESDGSKKERSINHFAICRAARRIRNDLRKRKDK